MINIHPVFTHFPIALFTIYSLLELVRFKKITQLPYWFYIKASFVILGSVSALATYLTGQLAEEQFKNVPNIARVVETHSLFATVTLIIFWLISVCYILAWVEKSNLLNSGTPGIAQLKKIALLVERYILDTPLSLVLALVGLALVTITGALGGSMVYGPDVDPIVHFIYSLFF